MRRDGIITFALAVFAAVMTFLLVRSEYFPETSMLRRLTSRQVLEKVLRHETASTLKVIWKGEETGVFNFRVSPGERGRVRLNVFFQGEVPVLGEKHRMSFDASAILSSGERLEFMRILAHWRETVCEVFFRERSGSVVEGEVEWNVQGGGMNEHRRCSWKDLTDVGKTNVWTGLPELKDVMDPKRSKEAVAALEQCRLQAWSTRIHRHEDWMDAYLLSVRLDENWWGKLWLSPTGELLKLESSFGLRMINEDFFSRLDGPLPSS
ncbi:MAG: hypothetical protein PHV34_17300 [Verrucomicrobiae bacterium]|nr:hypothetical protein [Verrucomicrobiae bacterium]